MFLSTNILVRKIMKGIHFLNFHYGNWIIYVKRESNNYTPVYYYKLRIANALFKAAYRMNFYD